MKRGFLFLLFQFSILVSSAQLDSVFWFVAPEISNSGHLSVLDEPIKLNIVSNNNYSINYTVSQPANVSFTPITGTIPANGNLTIDLTSRINVIENKPANSILPYGLLIQTTGLAYVYYEVNFTEDEFNPEIYSLKGRRALGTEFIIPGQTEYSNTTTAWNGTYRPTPLNRVDIVATENNTTVSITPSKGIVGYAANVTFTKKLDKGETYSCVALGQQASQHLEGTVVTSNNPIAITVTDDLLNFPGGSSGNGNDLIGDQIVPTNIIGDEYIAIRGIGALDYNGDRVYISAVQDNTSIYVAGSTIPTATINRGQTYALSFPVGSNAVYFTTSYPAYAFQLTGMQWEVGAALLPSIECTGAKTISYKRKSPRGLTINICVPVSGINSFSFNGSSSIITASDFSPVPGTNSQWYYTSKDLTSIVSQNALFTISNSVHFHMGVLEGFGTRGTAYAFFSDYGSYLTLKATSNNERQGHQFCEGDSLLLCLVDNTNLTNIKWAGPNGFMASGDSVWVRNIPQSATGQYIAYAESLARTCEITPDTIKITVNKNPIVDLGKDTIHCGSMTLGIPVQSGNYLWSTGVTEKEIIVSTSGKYWVEVDDRGCKGRDTIEIINSIPILSVKRDGLLCEGEEITLTAQSNASKQIWSTGSTEENIKINTSGLYWVEIDSNGCKHRDTVTIEFNAYPAILLIQEEKLCEGGSVKLTAQTNVSDILWNTGETTATIQVGTAGKYTATANNKGCKTSDSIDIVFFPNPSLILNKTGNPCKDSEIELSVQTNASDILWSTGETANTIKVKTTDEYKVEVTGDQGCIKRDSIQISFERPRMTLSAEGDICDKEMKLTAETDGVDLKWSTGESTFSIIVNQGGLYSVESRIGDCITTEDIVANLQKRPTAKISRSDKLLYHRSWAIASRNRWNQYNVEHRRNNLYD